MQSLNLLDTASKNYLKEQGVAPEQYLKYVHQQQYDISKKIGIIGTLIMAGILVGISASVSFSDPDPSIPFLLKLAFPVVLGGLGIGIGLIALRATIGIHTKFFKGAVEESQNFQALGLLHKTSYDYIKKIKPQEWDKIREFKSKNNNY